MLIDLRTYTFFPGKLPTYVPDYEKHGLAIQQHHCGKLLFWSLADTGPMNQLVQAWAYEDAADRDRRRAALWQDKEWLAFAGRGLGVIQQQENQLLRTTAFTDVALPPAGTRMIDLRCYTFAPGGLNEFLPICKEAGLPRQREHCGHMVFHSVSETGTLNQLVQAWAYESEPDYAARQKGLFADEAWQRDYRAKTVHMTQRQEHRFLKPVKFSPVA